MKKIQPGKRRVALSAAKKATRKVAKKTVARKAPAKKAAGKKTSRRNAPAGANGGALPASLADYPRLIPPEDGAVVRMYRTGHGDCFLIAFSGDDPEQPCYCLIDCGFKAGSPDYLASLPQSRIDMIAADIIGATGGKVQVAAITHEHEDHVNGIGKARFEHLQIEEVWLAWTEDPKDKRANELRKQFGDQLLGLVAARNRLNADGDTALVPRLDEFLSLEFGGDPSLAAQGPRAMGAAFAAAAKDPSKSRNKVAMEVFKSKVAKPSFKLPHRKIEKLPGASKVRVFVLGPPKDQEQINTMDPVGAEEFHGVGMAMSSAGNYFAAAAKAVAPGGIGKTGDGSPFAARYRVPFKLRNARSQEGSFFRNRYGPPASTTQPTFSKRQTSPTKGRMPTQIGEVASNPSWRQIDQDWLYASSQLALALNNRTNNTSLVLAFELGKGGKVLLFSADAQRGNWHSWTNASWKEGDDEITVKDLMARTVLYKAGHHASHNGTLNGTPSDEYANISWLGTGDYSDEFTAMITAVPRWAEDKAGWNHPFPPIKSALLEKARGKVFQTDTDRDKMVRPSSVSPAEWSGFLDRSGWHDLYFDHFIS